jgi:hypothetical protein
MFKFKTAQLLTPERDCWESKLPSPAQFGIVVLEIVAHYLFHPSIHTPNVLIGWRSQDKPLGSTTYTRSPREARRTMIVRPGMVGIASPTLTLSTAQEDSEKEMWTTYLEEVKDPDKRITDAWKEDADALVVFVRP